MGRTSSYPDEFRRDSVRMVLESGRPVARVAAELGISAKTLGNWVAHERDAARAGTLDESEREELRRLRKEVKELTAERDILRSAAAYFARETSR